ncbi:hypothetical protein [Streptomyces sp. NBC_01218]|uniref:hypothetical protein n=1 Tax=Streptomyces sp. NBC_01218 TaxID=2903780 RepID=UPI002E12C2B4
MSNAQNRDPGGPRPQGREPYAYRDGDPYPEHAYPDRPYPDDPAGAPAQGRQQGYGDGHHAPYPAGQQAPGQAPGYEDQSATQTWQGQTWDTRYQPVVQPPVQGQQPVQDQQPQQYAPQQAQAYGQQQPQGGQPQQPQGYGQPQQQSQGYGQPQQPQGYGRTPQAAQPHAQYPPSGYERPQQPAQAYGEPRQPAQAYGEPQQAYGQPQQPPQPQPQQVYHQPLQPQQAYGQPHQAYAPQQGPQQVVPDAAETAFLPPVGGAPGHSGSYPLPPEVPVAPAPAAERPAASVPVGPGAVPGAPQSGADGYGVPTTLGNTRITDAQRARAEGRSPIIAPGMRPAALTAVLGLLLAAGAALGPYALAVPLVLLQAVTAAGWFRLNGMWPARQGIALAFLGGFVADVALLAAGREHGPAALLGTLGVWVLLTLVLQLRSHAGADERMYGLMATVVSAALAVLAGGHLAADPDAVVVGGIAVAVAVLVRALPLPGPVSVVAALVAAAAAGAVGGGLAGPGGVGAALLGLAAGGCALVGLRAASYDYPSRFVHMTAGVALPLTAAAPAVYLVGRMIG